MVKINKEHQDKMIKILAEMQTYVKDNGYEGVSELLTKRMKEEGLWDDKITLESIMKRHKVETPKFTYKDMRKGIFIWRKLEPNDNPKEMAPHLAKVPCWVKFHVREAMGIFDSDNISYTCVGMSWGMEVMFRVESEKDFNSIQISRYKPKHLV